MNYVGKRGARKTDHRAVGKHICIACAACSWNSVPFEDSSIYSWLGEIYLVEVYQVGLDIGVAIMTSWHWNIFRNDISNFAVEIYILNVYS